MQVKLKIESYTTDIVVNLHPFIHSLLFRFQKGRFKYFWTSWRSFIDWLPRLLPRDSSSVPMDLLLNRLGLLPPLAGLGRTRFRNCFGRLLFNNSEGRDPLLLLAARQACWCCSSLFVEFWLFWPKILESPRIKLDGAEPRLFAKQDFNAKRRNAFSFSSSVEFSCPQRSRSVESKLESRRTFCSGRRFSFDWSVRGLDSRQTLLGRLEHRPRTGFKEFLL